MAVEFCLMNARNCANRVLVEAELEQAFRRHAIGLLPPTEPGRMPVVALEGKTLKGNFDHLNDRKVAQALNAFASEAAIPLAHSKIDVRSNEIPAGQRIIAELSLTGALFTSNPLHCQKIFEAARDSGNALLARVPSQSADPAGYA